MGKVVQEDRRALADPFNDHKFMERVEEASRRSQVAKKQFGKFRDVCIAAQQVQCTAGFLNAYAPSHPERPCEFGSLPRCLNICDDAK